MNNSWLVVDSSLVNDANYQGDTRIHKSGGGLLFWLLQIEIVKFLPIAQDWSKEINKPEISWWNDWQLTFCPGISIGNTLVIQILRYTLTCRCMNFICIVYLCTFKTQFTYHNKYVNKRGSESHLIHCAYKIFLAFWYSLKEQLKFHLFLTIR